MSIKEPTQITTIKLKTSPMWLSIYLIGLVLKSRMALRIIVRICKSLQIGRRRLLSRESINYIHIHIHLHHPLIIYWLPFWYFSLIRYLINNISYQLFVLYFL
jgi:hypothetical protein